MLALFFIAVGACAVVHGVLVRRLAAAARRWPRAVGKVLSSAVEQRSLGETVDRVFRIRYTHVVGRKTFEGTKVSLGLQRDDVDALHRRYPVGQVVQVHYNPIDPADCVLEPATTPKITQVIVIGVVFMLFGFGYVLFVNLN